GGGVFRDTPPDRTDIHPGVAGSDGRLNALDSPALSRLLQLGLGGAGSRAGPPDRQQSRLGPGLTWPARMVPRECAGATGRPGLLRSDQPLDIRAEPLGGSIRLVSPPGKAGFDGAHPKKARNTSSPGRRTGKAPGSRLLRGERQPRLRPSLAALRPVTGAARRVGTGLECRPGCLWIFPHVRAEEADRTFDLCLQAQSGGCRKSGAAAGTSRLSLALIGCRSGLRQTYTCARSSLLAGPKNTLTSKPASRRISGRSDPNSVNTGYPTSPPGWQIRGARSSSVPSVRVTIRANVWATPGNWGTVKMW